MTDFWDRVDRSAGPDACWPFTGYIDKKGYGKLYVGTGRADRRYELAHRFAYLWLRGEIPGECLDHICHDPAVCPGGACEHRRCCNPAHLQPTTLSENSKRQEKAFRTTCKEGHPLVSRPSNQRQRVCPTCHAAANRRYRAKASWIAT